VPSRTRGLLAPLVAVTACLAFCAAPARAGHYELDANQPTGSGSVEETSAADYSFHFSHHYPPSPAQTLSNLNFCATTAYGSITYSASQTYNFHWVPDEGMTIDEDPPVEESWEIVYQLWVTYGLPPDGYDPPGSGAASLTVGAQTYSKDCQVTQAVLDYMTVVEPRRVDITESGEAEAVVEFFLNGPNPSVPITASGSGAVDDEMDLMMSLMAGSPSGGREDVHHKNAYPKAYPPYTYDTLGNTSDVPVVARWLGIAGKYYKVYSSYKQKDAPDSSYTPELKSPQMAGTGDWGTWDFGLINAGLADWTSRVKLMRKNRSNNDYVFRKTHTINFRVGAIQ